MNSVNLHEFLSYKSLFLFNLALFIIFWSLKIKTKIDGAIKISKQNYLKLFRKIICISPNNIKDENTFWIILGKFKDNRILNCAIFYRDLHRMGGGSGQICWKLLVSNTIYKCNPLRVLNFDKKGFNWIICKDLRVLEFISGVLSLNNFVPSL